MGDQAEDEMLWQADAERRMRTQLWAFAEATAAMHGGAPDDYATLHRWSVDAPGDFWNAVWDFCDVVGSKGAIAVDGAPAMPGTRFFPDGRLNFAENLLQRGDEGDAIVYRGEDGTRERWSWAQLRRRVSQLQRALRSRGVGPGDRVAAMLPNSPEAVALMLATASIGAVWSSCSPDFGAAGVLGRFGQIAPRLFVAVDGYHYGGRRFDVAAVVREVAGALEVPVVIVDHAGAGAALAEALGTVTVAQLAEAQQPGPLSFERLPFDHPLFILFSSGTTGAPKCIVHSAGGTLLQHAKEHRLHCDIRRGDRVFYFTTLGWMMWNWLVSALAAGATLCLYDGSPAHPHATTLFDYAEAERFSHFGTSARFLDSARKAALAPRDTHDLGALRAILSTGSPLAADVFRYVYDKIAPDIHLASISGGTDIVSCFVLGAPTLPVWPGEIQVAGLGMAVDVVDPSGHPLPQGKGELVCTRAFPSMPLGFWGDTEGRRYRAAYFERFEGVWAHGDYAERTPHGGFIIHGRSDATLNPGGVRIGTAEIYAVVERLAAIEGALCVGQAWDGDTRIVMFVKLAAGVALEETLVQRIKALVRAEASPRHVPARIVAVPDLPRTRSGKLTELAVRELIHGRAVSNIEAIANPEVLAYFVDRPELAQ